MISRRLAVLLTLLLVLSAYVHGSDGSGRLHVRITFSDGHPCNLHLHVVLLSGPSSIAVGDAYTADDGTADFGDLAMGNYHVQVSADGVEETDSGRIEVKAGNGGQTLFVPVKRSAEGRADAASLGSPTVAAVDLKIPAEAKEDFDKATSLMAKQNWSKAKNELLKAVTAYPQYAAAYNNQGVVYARLGDRVRERESLQTAIHLDDHFAAALVNLATMAVVDHNLSEAEPLLNRAAAADPNNVQTLLLLAKVQFAQRHWEAAIATCHRIHFVHLGEEPFGHYIAAKALEQEGRSADAAGELHTFLDEEPTGARADAVRKEMTAMAQNR